MATSGRHAHPNNIAILALISLAMNRGEYPAWRGTSAGTRSGSGANFAHTRISGGGAVAPIRSRDTSTQCLLSSKLSSIAVLQHDAITRLVADAGLSLMALRRSAPLAVRTRS